MIEQIKQAYFIGIGGIGMSAIARFFKMVGIHVSGYDKTPSSLTDELIKEGIDIHFEDNISLVNERIINQNNNQTLIVVTPAIPANHKEYQYFQMHHYMIKKRAEVLGLITAKTFTAAIAGTHGKTTTTTMLSHILKSSGYSVTSFMGGIAKNYKTNFLAGNEYSEKDEKENSVCLLMDVLSPTVVEADEYDRSFLTLHPDVAIVTSVDADHLDIYGSREQMSESFSLFTSQIKQFGTLITKLGLAYTPQPNNNVKVYNYSLNTRTNFYTTNIRIQEGKYIFDYISDIENIADITLDLPGLHNVENAVAAIAVAQIMGVLPLDIKKSLMNFKGVERRFDVRISQKDFVYIDDYAHHPEEIKTFVSSVKLLYPNKKITGIFQPHLYTRTRDFAEEFSLSLSLLDEVILLEIYPARELPIEGVSSEMLLQKITCPKKSVMSVNEVLEYLKQNPMQVLLTIGAGDIDRLVKQIENLYINSHETK
ncbi:MAG: UDP-N-acetylmuramate--L-alanine ligase [Bacteroidia bacterium]|nr:UDP-N-acetylmuramate--L-alanine ligase [Bacteroidia bacterium]MCZ2249383.1 UDP-N-acetylmuramate--L-alanine ligase [Bacteroidia bacterium]